MSKVTKIETKQGWEVGIPEEDGSFTTLGNYFQTAEEADIFLDGMRAGMNYATDKFERILNDAKRRVSV